MQRLLCFYFVTLCLSFAAGRRRRRRRGNSPTTAKRNHQRGRKDCGEDQRRRGKDCGETPTEAKETHQQRRKGTTNGGETMIPTGAKRGEKTNGGEERRSYPLFIVCRWSETQAAAGGGGGVGLCYLTNTDGGGVSVYCYLLYCINSRLSGSPLHT
jgi:hypothetical protein